ncbi:hypothetical protein H2279_01640 [Campylobacter sp. B0100352/1]|uniref:hypothetical protein n=1 Tax=Campylobacter sp. B0100352/1 TaxID=2735783 RepID=UPI001D6B43F8|nr:hypothetical protein [Campylobacter sp. B0100352/1]
MEDRQKIARNVKIFALIGLTLGLLGFTPMIGLYFSLVSSILFIIVFYKLKVHAGAKNLFSNLFSMVGIIIFSGIIGAILIQGAEQLTAIVLKLLLSVIILIVFYKFSKNIFYEIARVTHQKYFIRAFYTGFIGILVFIVGMGLFLWNLEIRIINLDFIPMGGNMGFTPMSSNIDFKSISILAVASILLCVGVIFSLINFIYHALAWLNFESFDEGVKEENYTTTTQGLKLIKIIMISNLSLNFILNIGLWIAFILNKDFLVEYFSVKGLLIAIIIGICLFYTLSFISVMLLCKKIRSYKMLLFFISWIVFDCIGSHLIPLYLIPLYDYFTSLYGFFLCSALSLILSIASAFFFFKELVKISGMKIFFVVFIFLFLYDFYVWFRPIADILMGDYFARLDYLDLFNIRQLLRSYSRNLPKLINCIYIIPFIITWSRLKIKIMPKA